MKKKILIFQPKIQHYRLPLFDIINNKYDLKVLGVTNDGEAINGGYRNYFEHIKYFNFFGVHFWSSLIKPIIRNKPDIVIITASPRNYSAWIIPIISKLLNFKVIGWSKINSDESNQNIIKKKFKAIFYSKFDRLILYGEKSKKELKKISLTNNKIYIAPNTIDTNFYKNNKLFVDENNTKLKKLYKLNNIKNKFLCIGRMINEKRHIDIINAWKSSKLDKTKSKLIFVGTGPNYKRIKDEILHDKSILLVGKVPWGLDYVWLSICNFTVFGGAIGLACQQAFLMKCLVIAPYEDSSDSEFLINNVNSVLYKKENVKELSKIFETVINPLRNNDKLILEAHRYIIKERNIENMAKKFDEVIEL